MSTPFPTAPAMPLRRGNTVPCDLVTGFLGSGKTSMLRHVLAHGLDGRRVAIVMNEIGDIGIDGRTVEVLDGIGAIVELNSGCVCCTIDALDFIAAYDEVVERVQPDLVIIETTGLAEPDPILDRLESAGANCDAVITVVDALNFINCADKEPALNAQVAVADFLVLNKTDLVEPAALATLEAHLRDINPRAARLRCSHGKVPLDAVFAPGAARSTQLARGQQSPSLSPASAHHHHGADALRSFSFSTTHPVDTDRFFAVIADLPEQILRAKGIVRGRTGAPMLFNFVCGRLGVEPQPAMHDTAGVNQAVFIGYDIDEVQMVIEQRLRETTD